MKGFRYLDLSELEQISSVWLDGRKGIQPIQSDWLTLHLELKARVAPLLEGNNRGRKMNTQNADLPIFFQTFTVSLNLQILSLKLSHKNEDEMEIILGNKITGNYNMLGTTLRK